VRFGASPEFWPWREHLADPIFSTENLVPLLRNTDRRVRTLAIVALALKEDPQVLPAVANLTDDNAPSYPCPIPVATSMPASPMTPQRVSQIATFFVGIYMHAAGYEYYGTMSASTEPGFDWSTRP
jgi:hypothetical protein